ncbi:MAG: hypothetical protein R2941_13645 [Desulfobacterales bacterium]
MMESRFGSPPEWAGEKIESAPPELIEKMGDTASDWCPGWSDAEFIARFSGSVLIQN